MRTHARKLIPTIVLALLAVLAPHAGAQAPTPFPTYAPWAFQPVVVAPIEMPTPWVITPAPETPSATRTPKPTPRPTHRPTPVLGALRGSATWYCNATHPEARASRCHYQHPDVAGDQLYAAIRTDLIGHRGEQARVCTSTRCVVAKVIDCDCAAGAGLIDLYADAFLWLSPLGIGHLHVSLRWLR